jgi:hypothetical protein
MPEETIDRSSTALTPVPQQRNLLEGTVAEAPAPSHRTDTDKFMAVLARPEIGAKKYWVPRGATVRDLVQAANADVHNMDLLIGREKVTMEHVLQPNTLLFAMPRPKNAY